MMQRELNEIRGGGGRKGEVVGVKPQRWPHMGCTRISSGGRGEESMVGSSISNPQQQQQQQQQPRGKGLQVERWPNRANY